MWLSVDGGWAVVGSEMEKVIGVRGSRSLNILMEQPRRAFLSSLLETLVKPIV